MVIDIANMRDLGTEVSDHATDLLSGLGGINSVKGQTSLRDRAPILEIRERYEVSVIGGGLAARIFHMDNQLAIAVARKHSGNA